MSYTPRDNSGALFRNDRREKETHPDEKGDCIIDGKEYWISAWTKNGRKGEFRSLSFERKKTPGQHDSTPHHAPQPAPVPRAPSGSDDMDDLIPF